jgi:hypothetical protein
MKNTEFKAKARVLKLNTRHAVKMYEGVES